MLPDKSLQNKMNNKTITNGITMVGTILNERQMMVKQAKKA